MRWAGSWDGGYLFLVSGILSLVRMREGIGYHAVFDAFGEGSLLLVGDWGGENWTWGLEFEVGSRGGCSRVGEKFRKSMNRFFKR